MHKNQFKLRYLRIVLSALWLTGCNNGGTTPSNTLTPSITFTSNGLGIGSLIAQGESFTITATMNPQGSTIESQTIESAALNPFPGNAGITFKPSSCTISSSPGNEACSIVVTIESQVATNVYMLTMQNVTSSIQLINESIPFSVTCSLCRIFVTAGSHNSYFGGFINGSVVGADNFCINDSNNPDGAGNGLWKALLFGNNSTVIGQYYYRTDQTTLIAEATESNLVGNGSLNNSILGGYTQVWTGPRATNCNDWNGGGTAIVGSASGVRATGFMIPSTMMMPPITIPGWADRANEFNACGTRSVFQLYCVEQSPPPK